VEELEFVEGGEEVDRLGKDFFFSADGLDGGVLFFKLSLRFLWDLCVGGVGVGDRAKDEEEDRPPFLLLL